MIGMTGFDREPSALRDAQVHAATRVIDSHHYVLGREVDAFESAWAAASGAAHAVGVASGLDAIEISLRALGIGQGDEVVTTSMTAFATALAIVRAGAEPVLADIDHETALLSMESVEACLSSRSRAVVLVHLYGQARDVAAWAEFCQARDLILIEDCAQSHLAVSNGRAAGTFGPMGAHSFYPTKNLGALGDAGAIITNDPGLAAKASELRNYGQAARYEHVSLGLNSRLDEIQAAILSARLPWLTDFTEQRKSIASRYHDEIDNENVVLLAPPRDSGEHVFHQFVVTTSDRPQLMRHLGDHGVASLIHYPLPMHLQPALAGVRKAPNGLFASERHAASCVSIPCHPQLSDTDVSTVIDVINSYQPR